MNPPGDIDTTVPHFERFRWPKHVPALGRRHGRSHPPVGLASASAFVLTSWLLVEARAATVMPATVAAFAAAFAISYFGHMYFSFRVEPDHRSMLPRFASVAAVSFALGLTVTWLLEGVLHLPHYLSILAVLVVIPAVNYFSTRFWVFSAVSSELGRDAASKKSGS